MPKGHPLTEKERVTLPELFAYPLIIETPGCDNDIQHLLAKCPVKPKITYSFRDDTLIMAFVKSVLGVTISQKMVLKAFGQRRCRIQALRTSFTPDPGTGIFKDSQFRGVGDNVGVFKENDGINHKPD